VQLTDEDFLKRAPGLYAVMDSDFRCCAASPSFELLLTAGKSAMTGDPLSQWVAPGAANAVQSALDTVLQTGESLSDLEIEYGDSVPANVGHLHAWLLNGPGADARVAVHITQSQVTERLESRMQDLQTRNELILNAAGDGIYGIDAAGHTTFVNLAATRLLGWEPDDIIGKPLHDVHHHSREDGSPYPVEECPIYAALHDGAVHRVDDEVFWTAGGEAIPVEYTSTPITKNGTILGAVVVFRDIRRRLTADHQRSQAFAELSSVKRQLQLILNAAGEGIYGIDRDGNGTFANGTAINLLGWQLEDVIGRGVHEMHHHSHADGSPYPRAECPVYAALRDGVVHRIDDEVFWAKDGTAHQVEYTSTPILDESGNPDGAVVVFRDISERKRLEKERDDAFVRVSELNQQLENERDYLREEVDLTVNFGEIVGESSALKHTLAQVNAVAATPVNVLVYGESGVGKEMIARAIHAASDRRENPLIKVNCASIPKDLFESEFFGHVKGAFTGAYRDRIGRMQLAHGGTLFLDEVGEIPLSLQGKLLRALQESEFERVGEDRTTSVDVRIVAATNRDLKEEISAGRFREDLYYRLSVFPVVVPPLRERKDDILPLATHFVNRFCDELGRERLAINKRQASLLKSQRWSGNIRELKNVLERAVILSRGGKLRLDLSTVDSDGAAASAHVPEELSGFVTEAEFRELEKSNLIAALTQANWRVSGAGGAAELLGIKPSTLSYRIKAFGISEQRHAEDRGSR
jgi:PAS domain S-box-containing protein